MSEYQGSPNLQLMSSSISDDTSPIRQLFGSPELSSDPVERSGLKPKPPSPKVTRSSAERVVDSTLELQTIGTPELETRLFTDHENLYPFGLHWAHPETFGPVVASLLKLSISLELNIKNPERSQNEAEGQACLIKTKKGIVMATVKHNFCMEHDVHGKLQELNSVHVVTPGDNVHPLIIDQQAALINWDARSLEEGGVGAFKFNSHPTKPNAAWKYGREVEFISMHNSTAIMDRVNQGTLNTFTAVGKKFKCEVGMEVGIMAHSCVGLLAASMEDGLPRGDFKGKKFDTFITVGKITYVGPHHIEYRVNTVPGFSGGPVFLLGCEENHLKLIAIHAGYSQSLQTNFGFLVSEEEGAHHAGGSSKHAWLRPFLIMILILLMTAATYVQNFNKVPEIDAKVLDIDTKVLDDNKDSEKARFVEALIYSNTELDHVL